VARAHATVNQLQEKGKIFLTPTVANFDSWCFTACQVTTSSCCSCFTTQVEINLLQLKVRMFGIDLFDQRPAILGEMGSWWRLKIQSSEQAAQSHIKFSGNMKILVTG